MSVSRSPDELEIVVDLTQPGQRFRLRGCGLPGADGTRGDLFAVPQIQIPKKLTDREREIWEELARIHGGKS